MFDNTFGIVSGALGNNFHVYRNFGSPEQTEQVFHGLLRDDGRVQFGKREDIQVGDVIRHEDSIDYFLVEDIRDKMAGGKFHCLDVFVSRADAQGKPKVKSPIASGNVFHVGGDMNGSIQLGNTNSSLTSNVSINNAIAEPLRKLKEAVEKSDLDEIDRDDVLHEIARVVKLAEKDDVKAKPKMLERLDIIEKAVSISEKLSPYALPLIALARGAIGV